MVVTGEIAQNATDLAKRCSTIPEKQNKTEQKQTYLQDTTL